MNRTSSRIVAAVLVVFAACGEDDKGTPAPPGPYGGSPPMGTAISLTEGTVIPTATEWTWVPFEDAFCTDVTGSAGAYQFSKGTTGLAINWGSGSDVVFFLQGGGACWDWITCGGVLLAASTGPYGPDQFASFYNSMTGFSSWVKRKNLPTALSSATVVFIPYCTGDVHTGDKETTYPPAFQGAQSVTWFHLGHANIMAFLKRLGPTFPSPGKVIVAGSSAGGFGALANYPAFRWYWPTAKSYLVDDSGPPLAGDSIPAATRSAWYTSWNMGASLDAFCPECHTDMSWGMRHLAATYSNDRMALLSHLQDSTIRYFFGTSLYQPMGATAFETALRSLGTDVMDATTNAKYFFTAGAGHPTLDDPAAITTPDPGLATWLEEMLSDSTSWASATD